MSGHPGKVQRRTGRVRLGAVLAGLSVVLYASVAVGCSSMRDEPYTETASLPAHVLKDGTLEQVQEGGIIWKGDVNIPFVGYRTDDKGQVAHIAVGKARQWDLGGTYSLHLGESVEVAGIGTVTLVSFHKYSDSDGPWITLLLKLEEPQ